MRDQTLLIITAIVSITWLETIALIKKDFDGAILSGIIGTIATLSTRAYYKRKAGMINDQKTG